MPSFRISSVAVFLFLISSLRLMTFMPFSKTKQPKRVLIEVQQDDPNLNEVITEQLQKNNIGEIIAQKTGNEVEKIEVTNLQKKSPSNDLGELDLGEQYGKEVEFQFDLVVLMKPHTEAVTDAETLNLGETA